jgi:glycosyltransferase involved in cell wall biosynthesis
MRILVIAPQPFFSPRGTPFSVYYRVMVTCELGHEVDLLTYGQGQDVDLPCCRIIRTPALSSFGTVRTGPSWFKVVLDAFMILWTIGLLLRRRYDVVHAHEEAVFWCRWLKPVFRFRLIYDMHSSLPQQLDNFQFTRSRLLRWLFRKGETGGVRVADAVIAVCPALVDHARRLTAEHHKIVLIENSLFDPIRTADASHQDHEGPAGEEERIRQVRAWLATRARDRIIAYAGTLEVYQGIDRLLDAFSVVLKQLPDAGLLIVGGLPQEVEHFRSHADWLGLGEAVHFTGQVPPPEAQRLVGLASAAVSPRFAGNNTPMKIYQLMAAGIPLVATRIESHTQVLNDDIAILAEVNTASLGEAVIRVLADPGAARAMGERARAWYEEHYSREVYTAKMRKLFALVS